MIQQIQVYLGLGGNSASTFFLLQDALRILSLHDAIKEMHVSHFYSTAPLDVVSPVWFINAVCSFTTSLTLQQLFCLTQSIETRCGKVKKPKNASRPIDIDILFYGDQVCEEHELIIPHPFWKERLFVLIPLTDLTDAIFLQTSDGIEKYWLKNIIEVLQSQTSQIVSLLEKNPGFQ